MPGPFFIDSEIGNDSYDGLNPEHPSGDIGPKLHLSAVFADEDFPDPITSEVTINILHNADPGPNKYTETESVLELKGLRCEGENARLIIQANEWDQDKYEAGEENPMGSGDWDPKLTDRNMEIQYVLEITNAPTLNLELRGLCFYGEDSNTQGGLKIEGPTGVRTSYCQFDGPRAGVQLIGGSLAIDNCHFLENGTAVLAILGSKIIMAGDNYVEDPLIMGVYAVINSTIVVMPWDKQPLDKFTLDVTTTKPRKREFAALKAAIGSTIAIQDESWHPGMTTVAAVNVNNNCRILHPEYYCIVLESKSMITGAANISCTTWNAAGEPVTMPRANRIVAASGEDTTIVD